MDIAATAPDTAATLAGLGEREMAALLNKEQFKALVRAIGDAFDQNELRSLLVLECGRRLDDLVALPMEWRPLVTQVVQRAEMDDFTAELVLAVAAWKPRNVTMAAVLRDLTQVPGAAATLAVSPKLSAGYADAASALQGHVRTKSGFADFAPFLAGMSESGPRVCRIEAAGAADDAVGTGFLVADDLVLTNFHVRAMLQERGDTPACRFDHQRLAGSLAVRAGVLVEAADGDPWVAWSPFAQSDVQEGGANPKADQLDYALLRLAEPAGRFPPGRDAPSDKDPGRGHFVLRAETQPLALGEDVIVLQHPGGKPLQVAMGSALVTTIPLRCAHDAPTEGGTSGSPVLDLLLKLRALHHATDPKDPQRPRFNQAVPIGLIAADLTAKGVL